MYPAAAAGSVKCANEPLLVKHGRLWRTYRVVGLPGEATLNSHPRNVIEALYKGHADRVLRYAQRRMPAHDAEEVVAQTFLVAWRRVHDIPQDDPLPWLIGIARNVIRNLQRSDRRYERLAARIATLRTEHDRASAQQELPNELRDALASLSPDDREVLLLVAWDELDHSQAAAAMGWSKTNFRLRLHRARKRLRQRLSDSDHPFPRSSLTNATPVREETR